MLRSTPRCVTASLASSACRADSIVHDWQSQFVQEPQGLTGCLDDVMCSANGPSTPGLQSSLAMNAMIGVAFGHEQTLGRVQQETKISELNTIHGWASHPSPFILATFLCTLQDTTSERSPYTHPATLDTGPVASGYPGGIPTRSSTNHFQFARATDC